MTDTIKTDNTQVIMNLQSENDRLREGLNMIISWIEDGDSQASRVAGRMIRDKYKNLLEGES